MLKTEALAVAASLKGCPFCGKPLSVSLRGQGEHVPNPKARCKTENCFGTRLPVLSLDVPEDVHAWQQRAQPCASGVESLPPLGVSQGVSA